jgi:hypothetical protein
MYAMVTHYNDSVANQDVAFAVKDSSGALIALRVARTNTSGIAYADYRLPYPTSGAQGVSLGICSMWLL